MDYFHERLAQVGLAAGADYGFALAGGYAVQAAGLLERPSEDVDLFTAWNRSSDFGAAVQAVVDAYTADGLQVQVDKRLDTFARLHVPTRQAARRRRSNWASTGGRTNQW
jgi:hypothetical protein